MIYFFRTCEDIIRTLPVMQHDPDNPEDMMKQGEDHCFAGETLVETLDGPKRIDSLPPEGIVLTRDNRWAPYRSARRTRRDAPMVKLTFSNGRWVKCTPDHGFLDIAGNWRQACDLKNLLIQTATDVAVECLSAEEVPNEDAFCLTVPSTECFAIEDGIIAHNCVDSARYACTSRPYILHHEMKRPDRIFSVGAGNQLTIDDVMDGHSHKPGVHFERIR